MLCRILIPSQASQRKLKASVKSRHGRKIKSDCYAVVIARGRRIVGGLLICKAGMSVCGDGRQCRSRLSVSVFRLLISN